MCAESSCSRCVSASEPAYCNVPGPGRKQHAWLVPAHLSPCGARPSKSMLAKERLSGQKGMLV